MSERARQPMKDKALGFLGIIGLFWALPTAVSYVPPLMGHLPNQIITPGEQVVQVPVGMTDDELVTAIDRGCHHIPFMMRWIAGYPDTVRVEVHDGAREVGFFRGNCHDGRLIESSLR